MTYYNSNILLLQSSHHVPRDQRTNHSNTEHYFPRPGKEPRQIGGTSYIYSRNSGHDTVLLWEQVCDFAGRTLIVGTLLIYFRTGGIVSMVANNSADASHAIVF